MATIDQVQVAIKNALIALLQPEWTANNLPGCQVGIGFPVSTSLSEIIGEGESQITVYALGKGGENRSRFKPRWIQTTDVPDTLFATVVRNNNGTFTITFSGLPTAGLNIHTIFGTPQTDAYYQVQAADTLGSIASSVAGAVNGKSATILGNHITAAATGNSLTISGPPLTCVCNIGGSTTAVAIVRQTMLPVQISVWAPNGPLRDQIGALIENGIGLDWPVPFLQAADGSAIWVRMRGAPDRRDDTSESSYSIYEWHGIFECEYPTLLTNVATQIEDVINSYD